MSFRPNYLGGGFAATFTTGHFTSNVTIDGNLTVTGTVTATVNQVLTGSVNLTGALTVAGATTLSGDITLGNAASDTLSVYANSIFRYNATVWNDFTVNNDIYLAHSLNFEDILADPSSSASYGKLYTKLSSSIIELFYIDSSGNVVQITEAGAIGGDTVHLDDDEYALFGGTAATPDAGIAWNTAQTVDGWYFGTSDAQNTLIIAEYGDRAFDFLHGAQPNPTLFIHSAVQNNTQYVGIAYNKIDFAGNVTLDYTTNTLTMTGNLVITQPSINASAPTAFTVTGGSHSAITAATESTGANFNFSATKTWAAGAGPLATQREVNIQAPTYVGTAGGALTMTNAATVYISGAPTAGTNMTISNAWALWIDGGVTRFDGNIAFGDETVDIGTSTVGLNDLHFGSGGIINFDGGDITLTHTAAKLTWGGDGAVEIDFNNHEMTNVDINSGAIDGTTIGAAATSTGAFTTLSGSTAGNVLTLTNTTDGASSQVAIFEGDRATIADGDEAYLTFRLSDSGGTQDEGARITWKATTVLAGATQDTDLILSALVNNTLTTMLTLDGSANEIVPAVAINSAAAITGTTITGTSFVIGANTLTTSEWAFLDGQNQAVLSTSSPTFVNLTITSFAANWTNAGRTVADLGTITTADINGGSIDGTIIGGASAAALNATTGGFSGTITSSAASGTTWLEQIVTTSAVRAAHIGMTGTDFYLGTASSTGGTLITGSVAYSVEFRNDAGFTWGQGTTKTMALDTTGALTTLAGITATTGTFSQASGAAAIEYLRLTSTSNSSGAGEYISFHGNTGADYENGRIQVARNGASSGSILSFHTYDTSSLVQAMAVLPTGVVTIGGTTNTAYGRLGQLFEINTTANYGGIANNTWSATGTNYGFLEFNRSKSATIGTHTVVAINENLGGISFRGSDGVQFRDAASILCLVDAAVTGGGATDMPGRLTFWTTPDGSGASVERLRIDNAGVVGTGAAAFTNVTTVGTMVATGGFAVGDVLASWIDDATHGAGSTAMLIGNQTITVSSDVRIKENIVDTKVNALDLLNQLRVVDFTWKDTYVAHEAYNKRGTFTGLIAQEIVGLVPTIINTQGGGECSLCLNGKECSEHTNPWHVQYEYLVPTIVKGVQELHAEIAELKKEVAELKAR